MLLWKITLFLELFGGVFGKWYVAFKFFEKTIKLTQAIGLRSNGYNCDYYQW